MKRLLAATLFTAVLSLSSIRAQAPAPAKEEEQTLLALAKEVQQQQLEVAANQANIETKLTDLAETVRIARIYASRSK
jgi:hypothetical protein